MSRGTSQKCVRLADDLWSRFGELAKINGTTRTELLRQWVQEYIADQDQSDIDARSVFTETDS